MTLTSSAVTGVDEDDAGVASALLNASQQIGGALGLALLTAVATSRFDAAYPHHPTAAAVAAATTSSWAWAFAVAAALLLAAAVASASLMPSRNDGVHRSRSHDGGPTE